MKLPLDKQAHFWSGAAIAASVTLYTGMPWLAVLLCVLAAAGKELRDSMGYGTPDIWDFVATVCGCAVIIPYIVLILL
jgi:hypothetical protein